MKDLTKERALELHRQMWTDMQKDLGDNPTRDERWQYKEEWVQTHFPNENVLNDCFLCEYCCEHQFSKRGEFNYDICECPIEWPCERCEEGWADDECRWDYMPISKLLALPERKLEVEE